MDRRAQAQCDAAAERIDPERLRELTGCNLDPGHVAAKIAWLRDNRADQHAGARWFLLPGSFVAWQASGELAVDPSNASSSMLLDVESGDWSDEACAAFRIDPASLAPVRPASTVLGPGGAMAARGGRARSVDAGRARLRRRDGGDARRGRRRPGRGLRRDGDGRAGLRRRAGARARPGRRHRAASARGTRRLAAREPRLALRRRLPLVPRRAGLRRGGRGRGHGEPTSTSC